MRRRQSLEEFFVKAGLINLIGCIVVSIIYVAYLFWRFA